jgi:hypothetical protein
MPRSFPLRAIKGVDWLDRIPNARNMSRSAPAIKGEASTSGMITRSPLANATAQLVLLEALIHFQRAPARFQ